MTLASGLWSLVCNSVHCPPHLTVRLIAAAVLAAPFGGAAAQDSTRRAPEFDRTEVHIPMRDGVKLHTTIYTPKLVNSGLPLILTRTPYGISGAAGSFATSYADLADEGFRVATQRVYRSPRAASFIELPVLRPTVVP